MSTSSSVIHDFVVGLQRSGEVTKLLHHIDTSTHPTSHSLYHALVISWKGLTADKDVSTARDEEDSALTAGTPVDVVSAIEDSARYLEERVGQSENDDRLAKEYSYSGNSKDLSEDSTFWAQVAMDYSWEQLHCGYWKDVQPVWRQAYALGTLFKTLNFALRGKVEEAMAELDKGLLLGAPIMENALQRLADILKPKAVSLKKIGRIKFRNYTPSNEYSKVHKERKLSDSSQQPQLTCDLAVVPGIDMSRRISVEYCPSLAEFKEHHMIPSVPVVISGAMDHWPAYAERKWRYRHALLMLIDLS